MNEIGKQLLDTVGGSLTHAWLEQYEFSEEELAQLNIATYILMNVRDGGLPEHIKELYIIEAFQNSSLSKGGSS